MCLKTFSCRLCLFRIALIIIFIHNFIFCIMTGYILDLNMLGGTVISYESTQWVEFMSSHSVCLKWART